MRSLVFALALVGGISTAHADHYSATCLLTAKPDTSYRVDWDTGSRRMFIDRVDLARPVEYIVTNVSTRTWPLVIVSGFTPANTRFSMVFIDNDWNPTNGGSGHMEMLNIDEVMALPDQCTAPGTHE